MASERFDIFINIKEATASLKQLTNSVNSAGTAIKAIAGAAVVRELIQFGGAIKNATAEFQNYQNQLRLVTTNTEDLARVTSILQEAAVRNRTSFADTVDLFTRLRVSTEALGVAEERVVDVTGKLSQALQVAGADGNTASAVIRQFGQAMASGEVRGDEFRSLVEGLGPALAIMARESGITVGELRKMSQSGELTAEAMFKLLENSNSLTAAFNSMRPTITQLETGLSDAFDRALIKLGEVSGATVTYENIIKSLTRSFDRFAGTENALANLSPDQIFAKIENGSISSQAALEEIAAKIKDINSQLVAPRAGMFLDSKKLLEERKQLEALLAILRERVAIDQRSADRTKAEQERLNKLNKEMTALLAPYQKFIKLGDEYTKLDFATPLEKATAKQKEAQETLSKLLEAQEKLAKSGLNQEGLKDVSEQIKAAQAAVKGYGEEVRKLTEGETFVQFYENLVVSSRKASNELEFNKQAIIRLKEDLDKGKISLEIYNQAMKILTEESERAAQKLRDLQQANAEFIADLESGTEDLRAQLNQINMSALERSIDDITRKIDQGVRRQVEALKKQITDTNAAQINQEIEKVIAAGERIKREQIGLTESIYKTQRTFGAGWREAFREYVENATNAAQQAQRVFQKATQGMEDAIVNFAKTGKFEFRGFINSILEELLRSQVQQLIAQVFGKGGGGGGGSVTGSLIRGFAGFFANGGLIPAGQFGVVGERGPELVSGPAQITPMGSTNVVYNISAVDAMSFKQLVASDPGFLYAVTEQGRRTLPAGRR